MKKYFLLLIAILCMLALPINACASELPTDSYAISESMILLGTGNTEAGIYYEVYGEPYEGNVNSRVKVTVERTVVFDGDVFPPESMNWREWIYDLEMRGTLYLTSFIYNRSTNKTTAIYEGTLSG